MRSFFNTAWLSLQRFIRHDAWAISSHISLSLLMALFPFLIVLTALASIAGQRMLAIEAIDLMLNGWPKAVSGPIINEIHAVMTGSRKGVVTFGVIFALYFSSSGIEALRIGLNRAYAVRDRRAWWLTRLESIAFVIAGAIVLLSVTFLIAFGPQLWLRVAETWPVLAMSLPQWDAAPRLLSAALIVLIFLVFSHKFLPAGDRSVTSVLPGIVVTIVLWICAGFGFSWYLKLFPGAYSATYGSLATTMVVLVFLYMLAAIFIYGGEVNGLLTRRSARRSRDRHKDH